MAASDSGIAPITSERIGRHPRAGSRRSGDPTGPALRSTRPRDDRSRDPRRARRRRRRRRLDDARRAAEHGAVDVPAGRRPSPLALVVLGCWPGSPRWRSARRRRLGGAIGAATPRLQRPLERRRPAAATPARRAARRSRSWRSRAPSGSCSAGSRAARPRRRQRRPRGDPRPRPRARAAGKPYGRGSSAPGRRVRAARVRRDRACVFLSVPGSAQRGVVVAREPRRGAPAGRHRSSPLAASAAR